MHDPEELGAIMRDIFVSYRRSESSDVTGRIFDQMKARFGEDHLFKDVDSIPLGKDFRTAISEAVGRCEVLLAVIGKDWLRVIGDGGERRIDDPNDYVHIEIATALSRGIPVIPVLVENAGMPLSSELPEPLKPLAFRNATPVRADPDFHHDMDRLCFQLGKYLPKSRITQFSEFGGWSIVGLVGLVVSVTVFFVGHDSFVYTPTSSAPVATNAPNTETTDARVPIRFWVRQLPIVPGEDAAKLFNNALGSWQAVVVTPMRAADSEAEANVIIITASGEGTVANLGPPTKTSRLTITFDADEKWTGRTFEAASARMIGHILGLGYGNVSGQLMSPPNSIVVNPSPNTYESLPLTPQSDDIRRVREIWDR
jgi:hypothetical protein